MSKSNIRSIVSAIFVIVCVSLSCGFPRFTPKGVDLDDEMFQYLNTNMAGTFIKDDMVRFRLRSINHAHHLNICFPTQWRYLSLKKINSLLPAQAECEPMHTSRLGINSFAVNLMMEK